MSERRGHVCLLLLLLLAWPCGAGARADADQDIPAPRILLDQSLRAVEYQLNRLTADELSRVERKDDDVRYRPVYYALLTRRGIARELREEALAAIVKMDRTSRPRVLLQALAKVPADDAQSADRVVEMLLAEPQVTLKGERDALVQAADTPDQPFVWRGAYGGLMMADAAAGPSWQTALARDGHLRALLRAVPSLPLGPATDALRADLFTSIAAILGGTPDAGTRADALDALRGTRRDGATFALLAREVITPADPGSRAAAIRSLQVIPESAWAPATIDPLARAVVAMVADTPPNRRTDVAAVEALQLGDRLAAALPDDRARAVRNDLRALGVQVVRISTLPEQMRFTINWFVVEAGTQVQIVLTNPDAMPHNLVVGRPGALQDIGNAGSTMSMPSDPAVKPYVPDSPMVLSSTRLVPQGETERLTFRTPQTPGEYVYLCTYPGHWVRMYGVMLVVQKMDAWEANPNVPIDPMTKQAFAAKMN